LHEQPLPDDVRAERFDAPQVLEAPLDQRDLLTAVHPFDLEDRLGMELADGAGDGHLSPAARRGARLAGGAGPWTCERGPAGPRQTAVALLDVLQALLEQADDVLIVEGVEDHAAVAARSDESHAAKQ